MYALYHRELLGSRTSRLRIKYFTDREDCFQYYMFQITQTINSERNYILEGEEEATGVHVETRDLKFGEAISYAKTKAEKCIIDMVNNKIEFTFDENYYLYEMREIEEWSEHMFERQE